MRRSGFTFTGETQEADGDVAVDLVVSHGGGKLRFHGSGLMATACLTHDVAVRTLDGWGSSELEIVAVSVACDLDGEIEHHRALVSIFAVDLADDGPEARELYQGSERWTRRRGIEYEGETLEYYIEASELAVYANSVAWCDKEALVLATGTTVCSSSARSLRPVARVPISSPAR